MTPKAALGQLEQLERMLQRLNRALARADAGAVTESLGDIEAALPQLRAPDQEFGPDRPRAVAVAERVHRLQLLNRALSLNGLRLVEWYAESLRRQNDEQAADAEPTTTLNTSA